MRVYLLAGMIALAQATIIVQPAQEGVAKPALGDPAVDGRISGTSNVDTALESARMARLGAKERQKKITGDTTRLVKLATEVHAAVGQPDLKGTPLDVIRKTEEIEKLAHDLKHRMSGTV